MMEAQLIEGIATMRARMLAVLMAALTFPQQQRR
jgi:hypothetical protein